MKKAILLFLATVCVGSVAQAESEIGRFNLFYGFAWSNAQLIDQRANYLGGGLNFGVTVVNNTSIVGDFSLQFHDGGKVYYGLGGVRQTFVSNPASFFVEGLVGFSTLDPHNRGSQTSAAFGGGAGIDWMVWHSIGIRAPQIDVLFGSRDGNSFHDFRVMAGGIYKFD